MKVLLSPHGIGIGTLAQALRSQGVNAAACSFSDDAYAYLSDRCLRLNKHSNKSRQAIRKAFMEEAVRTYDVFHFHFGETLLPDKSDLKLLKGMGKKLVMHHNGSDARVLSIARSHNNPYVLVKETWPETRVQESMKRIAAYIDHAIINDYELFPFVEPYYKYVHVVPYAINVHRVMPRYPAPVSVPLVVHAPSHREVKGSEFVVAAVDRLKNEGYAFDFRLLEGLPHDEAKKLYAQSDIIIDQLRIGTYANLSMEAMAMGKPVICYIREDLRHTFPGELPIVSANPDTIYRELKSLLERPGDWKDIGMKGRNYAEQFHSYDYVGKLLVETYQQL
ncbi:glycosyltransferase [Paenibacillus sp. LHD-117]|uniref:glycosyltransferase n=1 Tax=Paenibacillus sp. LHD-117 TaxID=3071412 RepID=UPI0027E121DD|nr:glycosyltransferase [Paenibacillus sp. LHD-117]MDQ6418342.1 glycosyltransferase [Paenibacillus sp. LHD-117]